MHASADAGDSAYIAVFQEDGVVMLFGAAAGDVRPIESEFGLGYNFVIAKGLVKQGGGFVDGLCDGYR